jgi:hypothetical protein
MQTRTFRSSKRRKPNMPDWIEWTKILLRLGDSCLSAKPLFRLPVT